MPRSRISVEHREQLVDHDRREADRGLVDQHQLRLEQQRARDLQHLLLAAGERGRLLIRLAAQHREARHRGLHAAARSKPAGAITAPSSRLWRTESSGKDVAALRHVGDAAREQVARRQVGDLGALEQDAAGARRQHAEHGLEHGRLAGAVRADHRGDGAARNRTRRAMQDRHLAVAGDDLVEREDRSVAKVRLDHFGIAAARSRACPPR